MDTIERLIKEESFRALEADWEELPYINSVLLTLITYRDKHKSVPLHQADWRGTWFSDSPNRARGGKVSARFSFRTLQVRIKPSPGVDWAEELFCSVEILTWLLQTILKSCLIQDPTKDSDRLSINNDLILHVSDLTRPGL